MDFVGKAKALDDAFGINSMSRDDTYRGGSSISGPLLRQFPTAGLAGVIFILLAS
jgi:hypothetical protein